LYLFGLTGLCHAFSDICFFNPLNHLLVSEKELLPQLNEHQNIIYKLVNLYANSAEDKKDMYQEIVLQAWKTYPAFRGDAKFSTWLYRLCLNTIFTLQRKTNRIKYTDTGPYEETHDTSATADETERLYKAIRTLPETERAIVSLHLDGYDNKEIGVLVGITPNLVAVKLHRAKQQLATLI
jgi:RNA polymerase sigma factor (sigma-70 family)